ncbi:hypothetical protein LF817_14300 [Halobacillus sp. A1]|uniref:hypothetical protein n=1 Tax=Halobacillus sp. A1 TaxID=2880262 RepID=UPI0020A67B5F|nr:hypothetical protein [Halobacillus sp. A1]MCP3032495.1 hypothetical protein [Halobacillus sp. A1]
MFAGFNLNGLDTAFLSSYKNAGEVAFNKQKNYIQKELDRFVLDEGSLDGSALQDDWFPDVDADIFLSHSHGDQKLTMAFAAMLKEEFGLKAFIDSCVWGYADDLLKKIDDEFCKNKTDTGATYNYNLRNYSTSHVHMMLSSALTKMMDKTECLIFVNTPNSITTRDAIEKKTKSPWIYSEIATSHVLRKKNPERHEELEKSWKYEAAQKKLDIVYNVDLDHLTLLSTDDIKDWHQQYKMGQAIHVLDVLYRSKRLIKFKNEALYG